MAGDSAGRIDLDLNVNSQNFNRQMQGIQGLAKKAGAALAAAFAVKKIIEFGAQCIQLGSDLQEVQNVVDVTFPHMSKQVDEFAKNAAMSFGLSEIMAKKFTGTFGAMAKAFGFGEQQAYEMATALTGLSGDVASFYNISQDEAYTKLKSVFTGETESLKDLGVVMTQAALDQYALANGYGKTTQAMSEAEKVALRYKFVTDQLSLASGDFIRTSDGWANQVRVLKLQFDSLKATIGQGLINVLTPVIKVINTIIGKLMSLANAFKAFTEMVTGKKGSGGSASVVTDGMNAVTQSANNASTAIGGTGTAAKKAAKDAKGAGTGLDELNIISPPSSSGTEGGSGGGSDAGYTADEFDMGENDNSAVDDMGKKYQGLVDKAKELAGLFKQGFWDGLGDASVFDSIQVSIDKIKESLRNIFTASEVIGAADQFAKDFSYNLGMVAGSAASIGATIVDNLAGGLSKYLQQNTGRIKEYLVSMFDIGSDISKISGDFSKAVADIFTVFRSEPAKQITADIISVFANGFMGATELVSAFGRDMLDLITAPITENSDGIKNAFGDILEAVRMVTSSISDTFNYFLDGVLKLYNGSISPLIQSIKNGLSEIAGKILEAFNTYILPVIQNAAVRFQDFNSNTVQPLIDKFLEFGAKVSECIQLVWETILQPFILWFVENAAPIIAEFLQGAIDGFFQFWTGISKVVEDILAAFGGLLDFLKGVFTGDWQLAWSGIKTFLSNIWSAMKTLVTTVINNIKKMIDTTLSAIKNVWDTVWSVIKTFFETIWHYIRDTVETIFTNIYNFISTTLTSIKNKWTQIWEAIKKFFTQTWENIKTTVTNVFNQIRNFIMNTLNAISQFWEQLWTSIKNFFTQTWESIKNFVITIFTSIKEFISDTLDFLNALWERIWTAVKNFFSQTWEGIKTIVTNLFNHIKDFISSTLTFIKELWERLWNAIKTFFTQIWNGIKTTVTNLFNQIKSYIANTVNAIKQNWEKVWNNIKNFISNLWGNIKNKATEIFNAIRDKLAEIWDEVKKTIEEKWNAIKLWFDEIWTKIKNVFDMGEILDIGADIMNNLWDGMKGVWDDICNWVSDVVGAIGDFFSGAISKAEKEVKKAQEEAEEAEEKDNHKGSSSGGSSNYGPGYAGGSSSNSNYGPGYATGGFPEDGWFRASHGEILGKFDNGQSVVANNMQITSGIAQAVKNGLGSSLSSALVQSQANTMSGIANIINTATPRLAMIGSTKDSRQDPDIQEMMDRVMELAATNNSLSEQYLLTVIDLLGKIVELVENFDLVVNIDIREIRSKLKDLERRTGFTLRAT